jgi:O-antigen/teichoic acid export membrane protein
MTPESGSRIPQSASIAGPPPGERPGRGAPPSASRRRRILSAVGTAVFGKGSVLLVNAISVPITVRYLGAEQYGLWITISMTVAMLVYLDIGIASTLTNLISESYAKDDRVAAGQYFASAFWMTAGVAAALGIGAWALWPHIDFAYLLHIRNPALVPQVSHAVIAAGLLFLCGLPAGMAARALAGYQELHVANLFSAAGNILALAAIVLVVLLRGSLAMLVAAYSGAIVLGSIACLAWVCLVRKPWLKPLPGRVRWHLVRRIFGSGGQFFVIQLAGLVVFNSDNIVISHFLSPSEVTPYNVTWRLVTYANTVQILSSQALWPAYAEAWTRGQIQWIRAAYGRMRRMTVFTLAIACAILIPFGRAIIRIWAGPVAVPAMPLLLLMCVWMGIYAVTTNQACLMAATGRVRRQAAASALAAVANLALSIYWVRTMGTFGALLGTVVSYIVFILLVSSFEVRSILRTKPPIAAPGGLVP